MKSLAFKTCLNCLSLPPVLHRIVYEYMEKEWLPTSSLCCHYEHDPETPLVMVGKDAYFVYKNHLWRNNINLNIDLYDVHEPCYINDEWLLLRLACENLVVHLPTLQVTSLDGVTYVIQVKETLWIFEDLQFEIPLCIKHIPQYKSINFVAPRGDALLCFYRDETTRFVFDNDDSVEMEDVYGIYRNGTDMFLVGNTWLQHRLFRFVLPSRVVDTDIVDCFILIHLYDDTFYIWDMTDDEVLKIKTIVSDFFTTNHFFYSVTNNRIDLYE